MDNNIEQANQKDSDSQKERDVSQFNSNFAKRRTTLPRSTRAWGRGIVWSLIVLTIFAILYGSLNKIDSSINARGILQPIKGKRNISPVVNGIVRNVFVKNGQEVKEGQALFSLSNKSAFEALQNLRSLQNIFRSELLVTMDLLGIDSSENFHENTSPLYSLNRDISSKQSKYKIDISEKEHLRSLGNVKLIDESINRTQEQIDTNKELYRRYSTLYSQGAMSFVEFLKQKENLQRLNTVQAKQHIDLGNAKLKANQSEVESKFVKNAEKKDLFNRYRVALQELKRLETNIAESKQRLNFETITSPIDGTIHALAINKGELATPNSPSLVIIANGSLEASIDIKDSEIGFVKKGMPTEIRIDSYPFTEYGSLTGFISSISTFSLPPDQSFPYTRFTASVRLEQQSLLSKKGVAYALRPGMAISALIIVNKRPVISLITDKFNSFFDSARTIR